MSLTPIYDDLLREFEGIILVSEAAEAVQTAAPAAAEQADEPITGGLTPGEPTPDAPAVAEPTRVKA
ncbi:hypothetical protein FHX81_2381 [Saccharothrix saharensis]|uniref:Uncharacterized protein n=1 Tax=Saccharothrix saharensis TaxID=571190 RepID=A0A543JB42_9PSEU|nr:hypothetical protein [Saccharothrix saharensis]TQM80058.1 hypothetical protein FHX81_2381 [Saccharothrix saharensis]